MKELAKETIEQNLKNGNNYIIVDPKSNERKNYVIGLIFDDKNRILLINKLRPDWQKGYYNGIGGKVEGNETFMKAMIRETKEEANLDIKKNWKLYHKDILVNIQINTYYTKISSEEIEKFKSLTDEKVELFEIDKLPTNTLPDIRHMIEKILKKNIPIEYYKQ